MLPQVRWLRVDEIRRPLQGSRSNGEAGQEHHAAAVDAASLLLPS